ncbi:OmpA family protein [Sulfitobacter sp.]|uniref:OmpA family protein n=1 Tax=Sulfitobacter sp. TaxID=1903071 RepID=UPI003EF5F7B8
MKHLSLTAFALLLAFPAIAQDQIEIRFADGTVRALHLDDALSLPPAPGYTSVPAPPAVAKEAEGVTARITMPAIVARDSTPPITARGDTQAVTARDTTEPAIGEAPSTRVTVRIETPLPLPVPNPAHAPVAPSIDEIVLPGMNFATNKYAITRDGMKRVAIVAQVMKRMPAICVEVHGHTDDQGTRAKNQLLSENRAKSFRSALIEHHNIAPDRITTKGFGEDRPIATNANDEGRYANRRIVIVNECT